MEWTQDRLNEITSDEHRNKKIAQSIGSLYEFAAAKNQPMVAVGTGGE